MGMHKLVPGDNMNKKQWKTYAFWILLSEGVGALAAWLTRDSVEIYSTQIVQPPLSPPAIVFPVVWVILYALMGIGAARVSLTPRSDQREQAIWSFLAQLIVNFFWSILFFCRQTFGFAFLWILLLWMLILVMICTFRQIDPTAAKLQLPYLLWVTFAAYLNLGVWLLNRP